MVLLKWALSIRHSSCRDPCMFYGVQNLHGSTSLIDHLVHHILLEFTLNFFQLHFTTTSRQT
jgi:hypothetical protein